jgi:hypothetical protein
MIFFFKKPFTIFAFLLLFSIAVAPTININVVKASQDNDLVEVTSQVCGIQGYGNTTVRLAREQYQDLEQYLVEFRARLNQTSTREEAVPIFKDAVVELNTYGLLPRGMSVERVQQLVIGRYQETGLHHLIEKTISGNKLNDSNNSNYFCLVSSLTDNITSVGPILRWINNYMYLSFQTDIIFNWLNSLSQEGHVLLFKFLSSIDYILVVLFLYPWMFGTLFTSLNPITFLYTLTLGGYVIVAIDGHGIFYDNVPNKGWIATFGLNGKKIFQDKPLWGNLPLKPIYVIFDEHFYPGIFGFTGIQITLGEKMYHLGSALWVDIGSTPP